jgi:hypothetical protein
MGKRDAHRKDLVGLFDGFAASGDAKALTTYLLANSNLPSPRGNLELAQAFGDIVGERAKQGASPEPIWRLCEDWTEISAEEAPVNDPRELLPFCGTVGLGAIGAACTAYTGPALGDLCVLARDPRWRMREAVCFGLQRLIAAQSKLTLVALESWVAGGHPLEMRAAAAGVAEPVLLEDPATAKAALRLHQAILAQVLDMKDRKSEAFRGLRKGLGYTLSVVVCALPQEGFAYLAELAGSDDEDVRWILKQNLKKNRLIKNYPAEVSRLRASH